MFAGLNNQEVSNIFGTSTWYTIWDSGFTNPINPYFGIYTKYKPLDKRENTEVNGIVYIIKNKEIGAVVLDLEYEIGKNQKNIFEQVYYFPGAPKLLISPQKWSTQGYWQALCTCVEQHEIIKDRPSYS